MADRRSQRGNTTRSPLAVAAFALSALGCAQVADFDPTGNAATFEVSFTIDSAPPSAESCAALAGATVELDRNPVNRLQIVFVDDARTIRHSGLVFSCADSTCNGRRDRGCINTADAENAVIGLGSWRARLQAIDTANEWVAESDDHLFDVQSEGAHITMPSVNFHSGQLIAEVEIEGMPASIDQCAAYSAERIELEASLGGETFRADYPCAEAFVALRVPPSDESYRIVARALDATGGVRAESESTEATVGIGERKTLESLNALRITP